MLQGTKCSREWSALERGVGKMKTEEAFNAKSGVKDLPPELRTHRPAIVVEPARPAAGVDEDATVTHVHEIARNEDRRRQDAARRVLTGNAEAHENTMAGGLRATAPVLTLAAQDPNSPEGRRKREAQAALARALRELEDWIERLDEIIEELGLEIARLTAKMQQHFDNAHEAEDLLEDIQDGISEEERQRIVALLGPEAKGKTKEELDDLITQYIASERAQGRETDAEREAKERERQRVQEERNQAAEQHADLQERARNTPPEGYERLREETEQYTREARELSIAEYSRVAGNSIETGVSLAIESGANEASEDNMTASNEHENQLAELSLP